MLRAHRSTIFFEETQEWPGAFPREKHRQASDLFPESVSSCLSFFVAFSGLENIGH